MRANKLEFDKLQMYFMYPYTIDLDDIKGSIKIKQPTIGDIVQFGEKRFHVGLNIFITNASSYKVVLWDAGINWNDISDFELFLMLYKGIDSEVANMLFEGINFENFEIVEKTIETDDEIKKVPVLYNATEDIEINEDVYQCFHQYLQTMFNMFPEEKYTSDKMLQKWWVDAEKREMARNIEDKKKGKDAESSSMISIVSSCINHPGFKYNLQQLKDVGVFQFYDSVKRLQVYESTTALMKGMYSGMIDGSKIKPEEYNFMKEI